MNRVPHGKPGNRCPNQAPRPHRAKAPTAPANATAITARTSPTSSRPGVGSIVPSASGSALRRMRPVAGGATVQPDGPPDLPPSTRRHRGRSRSVIVLGPWVPRAGSPAEATTPAPPVVVVMLENQEEFKLNATNAPYLMSLKAQGRYFSNYYGVMHPSFANYLAVSGGSTFGFTSGSITRRHDPGHVAVGSADRGRRLVGRLPGAHAHAVLREGDEGGDLTHEGQVRHRAQPRGRVRERVHVGAVPTGAAARRRCPPRCPR